MKKFNYRFIVCFLITLLLLSLSFIFKSSYIRIIESLKDLGLSIAYYFCELFYIPYKFKTSVGNITKTSNEIIKNFKIIDFSNFGTYFDLGFNASLNNETLLRYLNNVLNKLSNISRFLLLIMPLIILIIIMYQRYFSENDNEVNFDSKPLIFSYLLQLKNKNP